MRKAEASAATPVLTPTKKAYSEFDAAHAFFNLELFDGKLPVCLVTFQNRKGVYGFYRPKSYKEGAGQKEYDEISMNPTQFKDRKAKEILSTLVHEMVHERQHRFGKTSRRGYHNAEWASMMMEVGLYPSDTAEPGGKTTGQKVSHYIVKGVPFDVACDKLLRSGFTISYIHRVDPATAKKKRESKTKYTCPDCLLNVWGKPDILVGCLRCEETMVSE
jgi:predicted SprT family Zn-dependent metalloprotease